MQAFYKRLKPAIRLRGYKLMINQYRIRCKNDPTFGQHNKPQKFWGLSKRPHKLVNFSKTQEEENVIEQHIILKGDEVIMQNKVFCSPFPHVGSFHNLTQTYREHCILLRIEAARFMNSKHDVVKTLKQDLMSHRNYNNQCIFSFDRDTIIPKFSHFPNMGYRYFDLFQTNQPVKSGYSKISCVRGIK